MAAPIVETIYTQEVSVIPLIPVHVHAGKLNLSNIRTIIYNTNHMVFTWSYRLNVISFLLRNLSI